MLRLYNLALPAARAAVRLAAPWRPKLRRGLAGRAGWRGRYAALGAACRGHIVWLHSTSVGEYEQARPVAAGLRERFPQLEILHTFFSPSGFDYARKLGEARHVDYLPEDAAGDVGFALETLRPRALVFLKFDLWPNLVVEAHRRRVPVLLLDATLQPRSWRSRWPARRLYRDLYARLEVISAVSEADAARFRRLVPDHPALHVDGDTRFDQVVRRRRAAAQAAAGSTPAPDHPFTLVAGSTWPADEAVLLPAWFELVRQGLAARLVVVPHEPTRGHLEPVEAAVRRAGLACRRLSELETASAPRGLGPALTGEGGDLPPVLVVDRVGMLAELYALGDTAFVGGAFSTGVHNLLEPAIFGLPVLFGPRHHNAPEASLLLDSGGAAVVRSALDLGRRLRALAADPAARRRMGGRARASVEANVGAVDRCLERLLPFLDPAALPARESTR